VQFDRVGLQVGTRLNDFPNRIDEQRRPYSRGTKPRYSGTHAIKTRTAKVEPPLRRNLFPLFRHECDLRRTQPLRYRQNTLLGRYFQVHSAGRDFEKTFDIVILYVAPILPQVDSDPVRSARPGQHGSLDRIRLHRSPSFPDSSHVVNVDE
jgi:hypothetical protein